MSVLVPAELVLATKLFGGLVMGDSADVSLEVVDALTGAGAGAHLLGGRFRRRFLLGDFRFGSGFHLQRRQRHRTLAFRRCRRCGGGRSWRRAGLLGVCTEGPHNARHSSRRAAKETQIHWASAPRTTLELKPRPTSIAECQATCFLPKARLSQIVSGESQECSSCVSRAPQTLPGLINRAALRNVRSHTASLEAFVHAIRRRSPARHARTTYLLTTRSCPTCNNSICFASR